MLKTLARRGLRKGLVEGSRPWLVVGGVATLFSLVRRLTAERPEVAFRTTLRPGDTLVLRGVAPAQHDAEGEE